MNIAGRTVLAAIPTIDGMVNADLTASLVEAGLRLMSRGATLGVHHVSGCSIVQAARNRCAAVFLSTNATDMLCFDADVSVEAKDIVRMVEMATERDIVAAAYVSRGGTYMLKMSSPYTEQDGLIKLDRIGMGAMLIRRHVIERLFQDSEMYTDNQGNVASAIFNVKVENGMLCGEDYEFCDLVRRCEYSIWLAPDITTKHYIGGCNVGTFLKDADHGHVTGKSPEGIDEGQEGDGGVLEGQLALGLEEGTGC